jgi:hypothetical protein
MSETTFANCKSCGAEVIWALTSTGRPMPIDATPVEGGNLVLSLLDGKRVVSVVAAGPGLRHRPHFATCPDADSWRHNRKENHR